MADRSHYGAAKAGVVGLTKCIARDLDSYGITCNAYAPLAATRLTVNPVRTGLYQKRYETGIYTKEQYEAMMNLPGPETVISLPVYLCTDEAANINGQVFHVYRGGIAIYSELETKRSIVKREGSWSVGELIGLVPKMLLEGDKHPSST